MVHCTQLISLLMFLPNFRLLLSSTAGTVSDTSHSKLDEILSLLQSQQEDITSLKSEVTIVFQVYAFLGFSSDER